jgi:hypothetical protein
MPGFYVIRECHGVAVDRYSSVGSGSSYLRPDAAFTARLSSCRSEESAVSCLARKK